VCGCFLHVCRERGLDLTVHTRVGLPFKPSHLQRVRCVLNCVLRTCQRTVLSEAVPPAAPPYALTHVPTCRLQRRRRPLCCCSTPPLCHRLTLRP
jgi:hypothetical protein